MTFIRTLHRDDPPGGGDPPPQNPPTGDPPAAPPKATPPVDPPKSKAETNWEQAERQSRFWASASPEDRQRYMEMIESGRKDGESPETRALREEMQGIKVEREVERALRKHGLDDDFEDILRKLPLDDIMPTAERLSSRVNAAGSGKATGEADDPGEPAPRKAREYKQADTSSDDPKKIAEALAKSGWMN